MKILVQCYSGIKTDERPVRFTLGDAVLFIESIQDQWRARDDVYFHILADDGNTYIIRHHEKTSEWTLESFRAHEPAHSLAESEAS